MYLKSHENRITISPVFLRWVRGCRLKDKKQYFIKINGSQRKKHHYKRDARILLLPQSLKHISNFAIPLTCLTHKYCLGSFVELYTRWDPRVISRLDLVLVNKDLSKADSHKQWESNCARCITAKWTWDRRLKQEICAPHAAECKLLSSRSTLEDALIKNLGVNTNLSSKSTPNMIKRASRLLH